MGGFMVNCLQLTYGVVVVAFSGPEPVGSVTGAAGEGAGEGA